MRLSPETARALKEASRVTGRSQQDLIRDAVDRFLGIGSAIGERERLIAAGAIIPGAPFQDVEPWLVLPPGMTSLDLLDRDDR